MVANELIRLDRDRREDNRLDASRKALDQAIPSHSISIGVRDEALRR
jgi:hypothetical protein